MKNYLFVSVFLLMFFVSSSLFSQEATTPASLDYKGGYKIKFDDEGKKYLHLLSWGQFFASYNTDTEASNLNLRRARFLAISQINDKFLLLTHIGASSFDNISGSAANIQLVDAWLQYNMTENHAVGAGLHYFNGISRFYNQGTLNLIVIDNDKGAWKSLGLVDQFANHLGVFFKGTFEKFQYQVAINEAAYINDPNIVLNQPIYYGAKALGESASKNAAGYFTYSIFDVESNYVPYRTGTYLGAKKVLNIGTGFFYHPNGSVSYETSDLLTPKGNDVFVVAGDVFLELPLAHNSSITSYILAQRNNYGEEAIGTGNLFYGEIGYLIPGDISSVRFQPYTSYALNLSDSYDDRDMFKAGINFYLDRNNCKLSLEYKSDKISTTNSNTITLQAMIYL